MCPFRHRWPYFAESRTFATRHAALTLVSCSVVPQNPIHNTIDQQIRLREKLLVILSAASITSSWLEDEVEAALEEERVSPKRRTVLVPIKIDNAVEDTNRTWTRTIKRTRHIGDFT
jgi:hypothetical protein